MRHFFTRWLGLGVGGIALLVAGTAQAQSKTDAKAACVAAYKDGQVHRKNGELVLARDDFKVCAQKACPLVLRNDCGPWLAKAEDSIPSIVVSISSATGKPLSESRILVDGKVPEKTGKDGDIEIDPGSHVVRVEAPGHEPSERSVKVRIGEKKTVVDVKLALVMPAQSTMSRPIPASTLAFTVLSLAGFGTFAGFGLHGNALKTDLEACKPACAPARVDEVKRDYIIADVGLGVGVVFLGLATWSFVTRPKVPRQTVGWQLNIVPGRTTVMLNGSF